MSKYTPYLLVMTDFGYGDWFVNYYGPFNT